jgi:hypothetical protein
VDEAGDEVNLTVRPLAMAVWVIYGKQHVTTQAAWRVMRFKRNSDGREAWAAVLPDVWGRWNG